MPKPKLTKAQLEEDLAFKKKWLERYLYQAVYRLSEANDVLATIIGYQDSIKELEEQIAKGEYAKETEA